MPKPDTKCRRKKASRLPQFLALGGFIFLIAAVLLAKQKPPADPLLASSSTPPEAQLDQALAAGRPVLAFFHSNNCEQCIITMDTVAQVYPGFQGEVVLVDVDVYDRQNEPLMRRVRLQYIPTLIFYDRSGQSQTHVGVMRPADLSERLSGLAGGP